MIVSPTVRRVMLYAVSALIPGLAHGQPWPRLRAMPAVFTLSAASTLPALPEGWRYVGVPHLPGAAKNASAATSGNVSVPATPVAASLQQPASHAIWLPLASGVGVAGFRAGSRIVVVIDGRHAFDMSALRGMAALADLSVDVGDNLTHLTFSAPPDVAVVLKAHPGGWIIDLQDAPQGLKNGGGSVPHMLGNAVVLPTAFAGRVVMDRDPLSGRRLLLGLVDGDTHVSTRRSAVGFALLPTLAGVVVAADADQLAMRATAGGFVLSAPGSPQFPVRLADGGAQQGQSGLFGHGFAFTDDRIALREAARRSRLQTSLAAPGSRSAIRQAAARDALALGDIGAGRSILDTIDADNPRDAAAPDVALMRLIVQALALRGTDAPSQAATQGAVGSEADFWRALGAARRAASTREASTAEIVQPLAAGIADLRAYPAPLRAQALALADEVLARADAPIDTDLAARELPHADAVWLSALAGHGDQPEQRAVLAALAHDRDPVQAAKAQEVMIDREYRAGRLSPAQAAERYGMMRLGARLAEREGIVESKELACDIAAGRWREAAAMLTTQQSKSAVAPQVLAGQSESLLEGIINDPALVSGDPARSLSLIGLVVAHLNSLQGADQRLAARLRVARRLGEVGLEAKALSVLAAEGPREGAGGIPAELALLRGRLSLNLGRIAEARAMLAAVDGLDLPQALREERVVLAARLAQKDGNPQAALTALGDVSVRESLRVRADACEALQDWHCAAHALEAGLGVVLASDHPLTPDEQAAIVRMGADLARAGATPELSHLRVAVGERLRDPTMATTFAVLLHPAVPDMPHVGQ